MSEKQPVYRAIDVCDKKWHVFGVRRSAITVAWVLEEVLEEGLMEAAILPLEILYILCVYTSIVCKRDLRREKGPNN